MKLTALLVFMSALFLVGMPVFIASNIYELYWHELSQYPFNELVAVVIKSMLIVGIPLLIFVMLGIWRTASIYIKTKQAEG